MIGFTCGTFDLCHFGHVLMFKEAKQSCEHLIVGVQTDPTIDRKDKNKPIQSLKERVGQVAAIKYVDEVIVYSTEKELYQLLSELKPDIRFVGEDWRGKDFTGKDIEGIEIIYNSRDHGYSSTALRNAIIKRLNIQ